MGTPQPKGKVTGCVERDSDTANWNSLYKLEGAWEPKANLFWVVFTLNTFDKNVDDNPRK